MPGHGVGEPLISDITLPRLKPFITACGGFFIGLVAWLGLPAGMNRVSGPSGRVTLPLMPSGQGIFAGMAVCLAGPMVAWTGEFLLTWWLAHVMSTSAERLPETSSPANR